MCVAEQFYIVDDGFGPKSMELYERIKMEHEGVNSKNS